MSSSAPNSINYARADGIYKSETAAAIVFTVVYVPLLLFNVLRCIRHPTYVLVMLSFFCSLRITAFAIRAALAASNTVGDNLDLVIAQSVIYGVGFFGLLYSAYTLVLDREKMIPKSGSQPSGIIGFILRLMGNSNIVRLILMAAVALGVVGGVKAASSSHSTQIDGQNFRKASIYIFLAVAILLAIMTAKLAKDEHDSGLRSVNVMEPVGRQYRLLVLLAIATLCLGREAYFAATSGNTVKQNKAALFYPIPALFELLAVLLFAAPGLVPSRRELVEREEFLSVGENTELTQPQRWVRS